MSASICSGPGYDRSLMKWILLLLTVLTLSQLATAAALHRADALKVMVVGNSITHGYEADYTWRYRIWQWFKANDVPVEFVGPYQGTSPPDMAEPLNPAWMHDSPAASAFVEPKTNGRYAADVSPDFDSHHFSIWGFQVAQAKVLIREMAATYSPDIMLVELGFNDIGWFVNGPEGTLADMKAFIDNARSGKRDIQFAIANIPQRTFIGGRDDLPISTDKYNSMLGDACASWSTDESPVKVVHLRETYDCEIDDCPAGHDGLHPNALGEFQIARAFSQALYEFGLGRGVLDVPEHIPVRPCPVPGNFKVTSLPFGVAATWDHSFGAYGYYAHNRAVGAPTWEGTTFFNTKNRSDAMWIGPGREWEFRVQADCGSGIVSGFTEVRSGVAGARGELVDAGDQRPMLAWAA